LSSGQHGSDGVGAEGEEMNLPLSLSIFTIEVDRKPILAFVAKKHEDAEAFLRDERVRSKLRSTSLDGRALCSDLFILRVRLANADERARYHENAAARSTGGPAPVFLVDVDKE
jgi:hypothetical protein